MTYEGVGLLVLERWREIEYLRGRAKLAKYSTGGFSFCNSLPPIREPRIFHYYFVYEGNGT